MIHRKSWGVRRILVVFGVILVSGAGISATAQTGTGRGRVYGTVKDESGAAIEGALVKAQSMTAAANYDTRTNKKGRFALAGFDKGVWRFTIAKEGFETQSRDIPVRQLEANPPLDFILKKASGLAALRSDQAGLAALDRGNALMAEGRFGEAARVFEELLAGYPEVYQTRLNLAAAFLKMNDTARASAEFQSALDAALPADPLAKRDEASAVRALSGLGETALKAGDFETARKHLARALEISPQDEMAAYNVGEIFFSNNDNEEAVRYFEMAVKIKNDWPKPYHRLGLVYLNMGVYDKALESLNKFIQLDPRNPEAPNVKNIIAAVEKMKT